jgi:DNA-binding NarL/FixJ family response regulator
VNKNSATLTQAPAGWQSYPTDRLQDLLSSFSTLRNSNRVLVDQLRGSIHQLRELRTKLRQQSDLHPTTERNGKEEHDPSNQFGLTRREAQVATLLARGWSNQAIARELQISAHTARHHTQRILSKLEVHSRSQAGAKLRG